MSSHLQLPPGTSLAEVEAKMAEIQRQHHVAGRVCGDCTACCTILQVVELNKPINTPCPHCTAHNCAIYSSRPLTCRIWSCEWWLGRLGLTDGQRPDKLGLMFAFDPDSPVIAYEVAPDAAKSKKAVKVLNRIKSERTLLLQRCGSRERVALSGPLARQAAQAEPPFEPLDGRGGQAFNIRRP